MKSGCLICCWVIAFAFTVAVASRSAADERRHAIVIGYNGRPALPSTTADQGTSEASPPLLRYADDDAVAFYQLLRELGDDAILLTLADADTRRRYPESADQATAPTLATLIGRILIPQ